VTAAPRSPLEQAALVALAAGLGLIQLTIFGWVPLVVAGVLWGWILAREPGRLVVPPFFWALVALAAWTLVSSAFSSEPGASFFRSRQLLFYLLVPLTIRVARGPAAMRVLDVVIAVGAFSALAGIFEYAFLNHRGLGSRPTGFLGHYMTFSGVIMLVLCAAVARLVFRGREWVWPAVAVPALLTALVVSESRNAWIGALAGIVVLLILRNWRLLVAVPVVIGIVAVLAPAVARDRARSIFDPSDPTNRDRVAMLESGALMIRDHPLVGVGPNMVPKEYLAKYKTKDAVDPPDKPNDTRSHLHNVPVQLAAERGLPAAAAWLWFVVVAGRDLFRVLRRSAKPALAATGLAAVVAMVVAGMFEHNFGDTEFLVLFLGLISLPFAAEAAGRPGAEPAAPVLVGAGPGRPGRTAAPLAE
jgi:putative inorganic carbon (HCO3(-)) transporter